jgi:predicted adenine nucleotide alpha hydrolase (AANH) superfamily ATPase
VIEYLLERNIRPALFYFNPNIFPDKEYERRKNELTQYAGSLNLETVDGDYDHDSWLRAVAGLEHEPECGRRCSACFLIRLSATARLACERGFDTIATTLGSSRWKNIKQIAASGLEAVADYPGLTFWDKNWRKDGLSERRNDLLRQNGFYNQTYCGCEFSIR